jgi:basic membrane lipoprotein Med (substrate-binding protein (PBP1-ABC) superfamily)
MEITVNEALQLKNQLKRQMENATKKLSYGRACNVYDDRDQLVAQDMPDIVEALAEYKKATDKFMLVNMALAAYTVNSGITSCVDRIKALTNVLNKLERTLDESVEKVNRTNGYGPSREVVVIVTRQVPVLTKAQVKAEIKAVEKEIRKLQARVFELNAGKIEINLEEDDLDQ